MWSHSLQQQPTVLLRLGDKLATADEKRAVGEKLAKGEMAVVSLGMGPSKPASMKESHCFAKR